MVTPRGGILASRRLRWVLLVVACLAAISLFLLATATANTELFAGSYDQLVVINAALVVLLMLVVAWQLLQLRRNLKAGVFGSRLALRLVFLFVAVAVLPGALVYAVSVQFLGKSIESWFDVRVDRALEGGINLGRSSLDYLLRETTNRATQIAGALADAPGPPGATLNRARRAGGGLRGDALRDDGQRARRRRHGGLARDARAAAVGSAAAGRLQQTFAKAEPAPDGGLVLRVVVPVNTGDRLDPLQACCRSSSRCRRRSRRTSTRCRRVRAIIRRSRSRARH